MNTEGNSMHFSILVTNNQTVRVQIEAEDAEEAQAIADSTAFGDLLKNNPHDVVRSEYFCEVEALHGHDVGKYGPRGDAKEMLNR
jgi:hypothetical protein